MLSVQPSFKVEKGRQVVRVYAKDALSEASSEQIDDSEQEESGQEESGQDESGQEESGQDESGQEDLQERVEITIQDRLLENQEILDQHAQSWILKPRERVFSGGQQVQIVVKPTASAMNDSYLNPFVYRMLGRVNSLDHFAELMRVSDWSQRYDQVMAANNRSLERAFNYFRSLPDNTPESVIHAQFVGLVYIASIFLCENSILALNGNHVTLGGILARDHYDLRGQTDPHFTDAITGRNKLSTEIKTAKRLRGNRLWLRGCTGVQTMTALYAYSCPTFLFSQKYWKLFVEKDGRDQVLTYPFGVTTVCSDYVNSSDLAPMGRDFLRAIVICLLSTRGVDDVEEATESITVQTESSDMVTSEKMGRAPDRLFSKGSISKRRKTRFSASKPPAPLKFSDIVPSFISGYKDGQAIRTYVRVLSQSETNEIEAAIEREERQARQASNLGVQE